VRGPPAPEVKRTTVFSSRWAQLAASFLILSSGPCFGQTAAPPPPPTWDPTFCRQVLVLDIRKGHEGNALLLSLCAPLSWWLKQSPATPRREYPDTGLYPRPKS
jgi:hypothetical protein